MLENFRDVSETLKKHPDAIPDFTSLSLSIDPTRNSSKSIPDAPTISPDSLDAPESPGGHPRARGTARGGQPLPTRNPPGINPAPSPTPPGLPQRVGKP
ncbi:hypothetical protein K445DRAFT_24557 [Daldinia sp. EC12]|nr:hypothetical protein K445DRAFT_24557 [Daldinia sp. EC12]